MYKRKASDDVVKFKSAEPSEKNGTARENIGERVKQPCPPHIAVLMFAVQNVAVDQALIRERQKIAKEVCSTAACILFDPLIDRLISRSVDHSSQSQLHTQSHVPTQA